jgi:hypothetical protein
MMPGNSPVPRWIALMLSAACSPLRRRDDRAQARVHAGIAAAASGRDR